MLKPQFLRLQKCNPDAIDCLNERDDLRYGLNLHHTIGMFLNSSIKPEQIGFSVAADVHFIGVGRFDLNSVAVFADRKAIRNNNKFKVQC